MVSNAKGLLARFSPTSLRMRLIVLVLLAVIPALGLILYTTAEQRRLASEEARLDAQWLARLVASEQNRIINETRQLLRNLTQFTQVRQPDPHACSLLFGDLLRQYPQYANLALVSPGGEVLCSAVLLPASADSTPLVYTDDPALQGALQRKDFVAGSFRTDPLSDRPVVGFAYPVLDPTGQVQSLVYAALDLEWLRQAVASDPLPNEATLHLIDRSGVVLLAIPAGYARQGQALTGEPLVQAMLSRTEGLGSFTGLDGLPRLYAYTPLSRAADNAFFVAVGVSEQAAFALANQMLVQHLVGLAVVVVLALGFAWIGGELFVLRRVRSLLDITHRLAAGDLGARTGPPYGGGELNQLALAFDRMIETLQQRQAERQRFEGEIIRHNRDLTVLNRITATISSSLDLPEVLESLKKLLVEQLNIPGGIVYFYDEAGDCLVVETAWGVPARILGEFKRFPATDLHYEQVVRGKEAVLRPNLRLVMPFSTLGLVKSRPNWLSYLCVPLLARGEVQGALDLFSQAPIYFTQDHLSLFTVLGQQVGVAIQNARLFEQLLAGRRRLQVLSQELLEIQEAERRHIARELHDEIGQSLTALKVNLQAAQRVPSQIDSTPYLEESISIAERTLRQVRDLSLDLRPSLLDDLGVVAALRWYIDRQGRRAGIQTQFITNVGLLRLPAGLETTCFRVVQEALTNVVRHAQAKRVWVELRQGPQLLELFIRDDGVGFNVEAVMEKAAGDLSLGLLGMQERVELVGGQLEIRSDPNRGVEIHACFPLTDESAALDRLLQSKELP